MEGYRATDRRPIASRERAVWKATAAWLVRRRVSANAISIAGMVSGIAAGIAFGLTSFLFDDARYLWLAGAILVQLRLLANMLDGMVAIGSGTASPVGELYNEIPDRVSDTAVLVGLGYALGGDEIIGFCAAVAAMFTAYVRAVGKGGGAGQEFCGPMAKPHRMFLVTLTALYCAFAPKSWQPIIWLDWPYGIAALALALITLGSFVTALRRLGRIARTLRGGAD